MLEARASSAFDAAGSPDPAVAFRGYARVTIQGVRVRRCHLSFGCSLSRMQVDELNHGRLSGPTEPCSDDVRFHRDQSPQTEVSSDPLVGHAVGISVAMPTYRYRLLVNERLDDNA